MAILKLTFSGFSQHKARVVLTVLAIALSVSLVVAVTTGFSSLQAAVFRYFTEFMGSTDIEVTHQGDPASGVPQNVLAQIRQDPAVEAAVGRIETETRLLDQAGKPPPGNEWRMMSLIGVELPADAEVFQLPMEEGAGGRWWSDNAAQVAVVDQELAKLMNLKVGDELRLPGVNKQLNLKVAGVAHKPAMMASIRQTVYVPLATLQDFLNARGKITRILINLHTGADDEAFERRWQPKLSAMDPLLKLKSARSSREELDRNFQSIEILSYFGGAISMLAATFIVFSTLSMGVTERHRVLAMLRAIGAQKRQIGAAVVAEGLALAIVGILIGAPLGLLWVKILVLWKPDFFYAGMVPSIGGILFGTIGSLAAALAASFLPAWSAMRVSPLEGMTVQGQPRRTHVPLRAAMAGLALIFVDTLITHVPQIPRSATYYGHLAIGLPTILVGYFLLAPGFVWLVEKILGPAVAAVLRVRYGLIVQQLTGSIWRAAGTGAALMVGLAILIVMQTQGNTMLKGWRLPDKFPDFFIFAPFGLPMEQARVLETVPGIKKDDVLGIGIGVAGLPAGFLSMAGLAVVPDATLFLGIDPDKAMRMIELEFRQGDAATATRLLNQGRHILVTDEFRQLKGLGVGDKLKLKTPKSGEVEYTIAGVVWSPGIDVFVTRFDMGRQFEQRSAGTVFGSMADARRDFGVEKINLFAVNLEPFIKRTDLEQQLREKLGSWGLRAGDVRHIKFHIQQGFYKLLMLVSTVAFAAIGVASLGVTNTIMASIRSRRWQLGILRSVGMTRWQMIRMVMAEALLLGTVGCVLGLAAGMHMSVNANGLSRKLIGYGPPIDVPWSIVWMGIGIVMAVAVVASFWPALQASREEPLSLLQAGRAAA